LPGCHTSERLSSTVTFLFTDIEGSTGLLKQLGRERYGELLARHQVLLREAFAANRGEEIDTQGDSFFVAFRSASDAVAAGVAIQRVLADYEWPEGTAVRVRVGIHSGEASATGERYVGFSVHRAARIGSAGHGGQVLLSDATRLLVEDDLPAGVYLKDLGAYRLKDVDRPERISQLCAEGLQFEFPSPRGAEPVKATPLSSDSHQASLPAIFLSYRRDDSSGHAGRLYDDLVDRFGEQQVFMDIDAIDPGVDFTEVVNRMARSCDVLLAVIGRRWLDASDASGTRRLDQPEDYVRTEIQAALEGETISVIPVLVQGAEMPASAKLPVPLKKLAHRQAAELSDGRWGYDVGQLVQRLEQLADERRAVVHPFHAADHNRGATGPTATAGDAQLPRHDRGSLRWGTSRRRIAAALVVAGVSAGLVIGLGLFVLGRSAGSGGCGSSLAATIGPVTATTRVPWGRYLDEINKSPANYTDAQLHRLGIVLNYSALLEGFKGEQVSFRSSLQNAETSEPPNQLLENHFEFEIKPEVCKERISEPIFIDSDNLSGKFRGLILIYDQEGTLRDQRASQSVVTGR
jgi:class 3 adenylate cyclase